MGCRKINIFIILVGFTVSVFGQQDPQFTQYMYTILPINPGYAGNAGICASLQYRQQWAGFTDIINETGERYKTAPRDALVSIHTPIKQRHGIGLTIFNDALGYQSDIAVKLAYAYRMNISGGTLGIGLSGDFLSRTVRSDLYVIGQSGDPLLIADMGTDMHISPSFGVFFQMQQKWYAGISGTRLVSFVGGDKDYQKGKAHVYFLGGYTYELPSNPDWKLKPSALLKSDLTNVQMDLTVLADYTNLIWFGISYRMPYDIAVLVGAKPFINFSGAIKGLEVIGSYDINPGGMGRWKKGYEGRSLGGYEFCIKYCFNIVQTPTVYGYKNTKLLGNRPIEYR